MFLNIRTRFKTITAFTLVFCYVGFGTQSAQAQGLIKTMVEQIARLQLTLQEARQGYAIAEKGLTVIGDIKEGDFGLHSGYFSSLSTVKSPVRNYARVADILRMQLAILDDCRTTAGQLSPTGLYTPAQLAWYSRVFASLAEKTGRDMDELSGILSDGQWQMTDEDRLTGIDDLYRRVSEKYSFCRSFCDQARVLGARRSFDIRSFSNLPKLF